MKASLPGGDFASYLRRSLVMVRTLPRMLVLRHHRVLEFGLLLLALIFVALLAGWLLYIVPGQVIEQPSIEAPLAAEALEEVVSWIEARERARETGLVFPERPLFVD